MERMSEERMTKRINMFIPEMEEARVKGRLTRIWKDGLKESYWGLNIQEDEGHTWR